MVLVLVTNFTSRGFFILCPIRPLALARESCHLHSIPATSKCGITYHYLAPEI
jgi:hypothetical protein